MANKSFPFLSLTSRLRSTPYSQRLDTLGIQAYTVYNHMLLPTVYKSIREDCAHLKESVQLWDVSCERQIYIEGRDAFTLVQKLTPRDLSSQKINRCTYIPVVDNNGGMLNDPVCIKLSDTHFSISIADSDLLLWIKGIATALQLEVNVYEPNIYPLAVQGPKSDLVMKEVFGDKVTELKFFGCDFFDFKDHSFLISKSGFSKQGGYEIYVKSSKLPWNIGEQLWDSLMEAGRVHDIRPGGPNYIERVESGLLSYGNDMNSENTPDECGLSFFYKDKIFTGCIGGQALIEKQKLPTQRKIRSLSILGDAIPACRDPWMLYDGGNHVGKVTSAIWSPDFETHVAIGMVDSPYWEAGTSLVVETPEGMREVIVQEKSFN